jgi:hypothetical protein
MAFEDELPQAPTGGTQTEVVDFGSEIDASAFDGVGKLGDAIPAGTYHFRLDTQTKGKNKNGPYYSIQWKCQEEPYVGRIAFDTITWLDQETLGALKAGPSNPGFSNAKSTANSRLVRANSLMEAAGMKPVGNFNFETWLNTHPEVKLTLSLREKKLKDDKSGEYTVPTGEMQNNVSKYVALQAPRG